MAADPTGKRERMVVEQLARRGIRSPAVLDAMRTVPRERFMQAGAEDLAYDDGAFPIDAGQTISQPLVVALMVEAAELDAGARVLEVGAGSGYAAAVMSRIAGEVFGIERQVALVAPALARLEALGYRNVALKAGDGTEGWPEMAPFDAIVVSAGGPSVPETLKAQLGLGGRLVIPVGDHRNIQRLKKITRIGDREFTEQDLGAVAFVPLVGREGWADEGSPPDTAAMRSRSLPEAIAEAAEPLPPLDSPAFAAFADRFAGKRVVLLGEASHGTSEFYRARALITQRLVERHGFRIVAAEADWPDAAYVNREIRGEAQPEGAAPPFRRFPTWMWRNREATALFAWMRDFNRDRPASDRAGFFGLDIYNMSASIAAVLTYLNEIDPEAAREARERYGCLAPWQKNPATYGRAVLSSRYETCEKAVVAQCRALLGRELDYAGRDSGSFLDAAQNARLIASAEKYYRIMYYGGAESWNLRDGHMAETLGHLLDWQGPDAKAVVWAHNSHIGDARFTEMGFRRGELNLGQLARERWDGQTALVGFGTHAGTVAAASDWDEPMEIKRVRPSRGDSYERLCHDAGMPRFLLDFSRPEAREARERLLERRLERFIGVIYRPDTELQSHYADASLSRQFDAYVWLDETTAVSALPAEQGGGVPDTYPFGV